MHPEGEFVGADAGFELVVKVSLGEMISIEPADGLEHATLALEWLRRARPHFEKEFKTYLFSEGEIAHLEEETTR